MDYIYQEMFGGGRDIKYLDYHSLNKYNEEYVVLPVIMPMADYYPNGFADRFSDRIIPVFLSLTMVKPILTKKEIDYLKKYEPIGCRDEHTLITMRKYGIKSYLNGCITITLPFRSMDNNSFNRIFIVDVERKAMNCIPDNIKDSAKYRTHTIKKVENPKSIAIDQYREYKETASLIITSRLHCAVPCLAAGIPVILIRDNITYRMSWLEKILPIYTSQEARHIKWYPEPVDRMGIENQKRIVKSVVKDRLEAVYENNQKMLDLSYFYENRNKSNYTIDACIDHIAFLKENWKNKNGNYKYSFWGLNQNTEWLVEYISENYPNAVFCHVYDTYREVEFRGEKSLSPQAIANNKEETIFVTSKGVKNHAKSLFDEISLPPHMYSLP